jgi:IS5 family transposase
VALDETTICKFRHLIEAKGLSKMMLTAVNDHLESKGIKIGTRTIMDATLISAPSRLTGELRLQGGQHNLFRSKERWGDKLNWGKSGQSFFGRKKLMLSIFDQRFFNLYSLNEWERDAH